MNNVIFGKNYVKCQKYKDIKLVTAKRRRNNLVSEPNCYWL